MYSATTALRMPVTRNRYGIDRPAARSAIASPADATMNSAFRMLLAAMIRDR